MTTHDILYDIQDAIDTMEEALREDEYDETERLEIESIIGGLFIARGIVMKHMASEGTNGG